MPSIVTRPVPALDLLTAQGPFATVHLPTPSDVEQAADRFEATVKSALDELERVGATLELIGRIRDEANGHEHFEGETLVVVANPHDAWSWAMPGPTEHVQAEVSSLPRIGRLIEEARRTLPHIVVLIDREGADIDVVHDGEADDRHLTVEGDTDVVHKSPQGGWSQRRLQQRVENTWEENAQDVARMVGELYGSVRPAAVFVAGDQRAVNFFLEHLPTEVGEIVHALDHGSRADGADLDGLRTDVEHVLADLIARQTTEHLERFGSARANDGAVDGVADTLRAVFEGRVELLLVHADPDDERTAWFGPEPGQVSADQATLEALGLEAEEGPLLEVALRGAHGTGSQTWFVPAHGTSAPAEGIGAVLRG